MNKASDILDSLTKTQSSTLARILPLMLASENCEITEYVADSTPGVYRPALQALVSKGILTAERKPFLMPAGPYAGQEMDMWHYAVA